MHIHYQKIKIIVKIQKKYMKVLIIKDSEKVYQKGKAIIKMDLP